MTATTFIRDMPPPKKRGTAAKYVLLFVVGIVLCAAMIAALCFQYNSGEGVCYKHGFTEFKGGNCVKLVDGTEFVRSPGWVKAHCNEFGECQE